MRTGRKSSQQVEELELNEKFLSRKRKLSNEGNNIKVITRNNYNKNEFNKDRDRLKIINDTLLEDNQKYNNTISLDSDSEVIEIDLRESTTYQHPLGKFFDHESDRNGEIKNISSSVSKHEKPSKMSHKEKESSKPSSKRKRSYNFSPSDTTDNNKQIITPFETQDNFIGIPIKDTKNNIQINSIMNMNDTIDFPWLSERSTNERGMIKLHWEIIEFYEFIKPTSEEDLIREKTISNLKDLIREHFPDLKVKKFGSFPNKIHLPDSDVDIVVLSKNKNMDQTKILKKITQKLIDNEMVDFIKIIEARVPIIRATIKNTKINMDISANRKNGYEAKKVIKRTLEDFPHMRPLIYVLKYFLRQRKLNESYTGGISSFLLFNLLFAYIQYAQKENDSSMKTLGHLLTGFLQFYSFVFNFEDVGISIRHGGFFYKKSESTLIDPKKNTLLSVENFQELDQDVGKGSFKFRKVLDCFKQARDALFYPSQHPIKSYIGSFINVDHFIIERYQKLKQYNKKLN